MMFYRAGRGINLGITLWSNTYIKLVRLLHRRLWQVTRILSYKLKSPRRDMKRKENEKGLSNDRQIDLLGNKSLLEKRINIRASDYRFEDKTKYYQGFVNSRGRYIGRTENLELKNISNVYKKFGEKEIVEMTNLFIDDCMNLLDKNGLIA